MSGQSTVQGSVTLRKMRSGATAQISLSSTKQLFQLYSGEGSSAVFSPDWTVAANRPVVSVNASASQGVVSVTSVVWKINNTVATTISGITSSSSGGTHTLTIGRNLGEAAILNFNSGTLSAIITYSDSTGESQTVTKTETIRIQQAVENGYNVMINATKTYVDANASSASEQNATLSAVCYYGLNPMQEGTVIFKWYNTTAQGATAISTGADLIVDPSMVNGSQLFICRAEVDGTEVDAEGVVVVDNSDSLVLSCSVQQSKAGTSQGDPQVNVSAVSVASENDSTRLTYKVTMQDGSAASVTPTAWKVQKMHADTIKLIQSVSGADYTKDTDTEDTYNTKEYGGQATAYIDVVDADFVSVGTGSTARHDTEVLVTAEATINS